MVAVNVRHEVSPIQVAVAVELDVSNYEEIARKESGRIAGLLSSLSLVRTRVDDGVRERVEQGVSAGLAERLRPELIAAIERRVADSIRESLADQLAENGVQADTKVTVTAR